MTYAVRMRPYLASLAFLLLGARVSADPPAPASPSPLGPPHICRASSYPTDAIRSGTTGTVVLDFHVAVDGSTRDIIVRTSSGSAVLDNTAEACAAAWRYHPATRNGQSVEVPWTATINFALPDRSMPVPLPDRSMPVPAEDSNGDYAFTQRLRERLQLYTPHKLSIPRLLVISLQYPTGPGITINLERLQGECLHTPANCDRLVDGYVQDIARLLLGPETPLSRENLRVGLFYSRRDLVESPDRAVERRTFGHFYETCFRDTERHRFGLTLSNATTLGLSFDDALSLCEQDTQAALGPMPAAYGVPANGGIGIVEGSNYESSRLLFLSQWKGLARALGGNLIVAVPDQRVVLYSSGDSKAAVKALEEKAHSLKSDDDSWPLSDDVFRWTENGWVDLSDTD